MKDQIAEAVTNRRVPSGAKRYLIFDIVAKTKLKKKMSRIKSKAARREKEEHACIFCEVPYGAQGIVGLQMCTF